MTAISKVVNMASTLNKTKTETNVVDTENQASAISTFFAWWRSDVSEELAYRYWRDVHGVWAARTPGFRQYRQFHLDPAEPSLLRGLEGIETDLPREDQPNGIAHIAYSSRLYARLLRLPFALKQAEQDDVIYVGRNTFHRSSLPYSRTFVDRLNEPTPHGPPPCPRFLLAFKKRKGLAQADFRTYLAEELATSWATSNDVLRLRVDIFAPYVETPSSPGAVSHIWDPDKRYDATIDVAVSVATDAAAFFASSNISADKVTAVHAYPVREIYTLVYDGKPTLVGLRGYAAMQAIEEANAEFQKSSQVLKFTYGPVVDGARLWRPKNLIAAGAAMLAGLTLGAIWW